MLSLFLEIVKAVVGAAAVVANIPCYKKCWDKNVMTITFVSKLNNPKQPQQPQNVQLLHLLPAGKTGAK